VPDLRQYGLDRRISSFRIASGEFWEGCEQPNFRGRCQVFNGEQRNLSGSSWNDLISSLRRVNSAGGDVGLPPPTNVQIVLFAQPNFRGESRTFTGSAEDLRSYAFANRARSARVVGVWQLCRQISFGGCTFVNSDWANLAEMNLASNVRSLRPVPSNAPGVTPVPPIGEVPRLLLYANAGFGGQNIVLDRETPDAKIVAARSAKARGAWLVCSEPNFRGTCRELSGSVRDLRTLGLSTIRSARPR
jgi:hypothetical protein